MREERLVIFENALVIDGAGTAPFQGSLGIQNGVIAFVQPQLLSSQREEEGAVKIDLTGYTVTPGLIDCHVHLVSPWNKTAHEPYWKLTTSPSMKALTAASNANLTLRSGFTTVRNCGGTSWNLPEDVCVRDAVKAGMIIASKVWAAAGGITMTGGHGDRAFPPYVPAHSEVGFGVQPADGADACRRAVRDRIKYGADFIKIYTTGGVSTPGDGPHSEDFTLDELLAITDEAHTHGKRVATHAQGLAGIRKAVAAGVDTVEHGSFLDERTADEMAAAGTVMVTTLRVFEEILRRGRDYPNPDALRKAEMVCEAQRSALMLAKKSGVTLAMGTDASQSIRNGDNALEMLELVNAGFSAGEVLSMSTSNAAVALGLENSIGTLRQAMGADLLILDGNPLERIDVLSDPSKIRCVLQDGVPKILRDDDGAEYQSPQLPWGLLHSLLLKRKDEL